MNSSLALLSRAVIVAALATIPIAASANTLIFADNFNNSNTTTTDLDSNLVNRQSGSWVTDNGPVSYIDGSAGALGTKDFQLRQNQLQTNLGGTTTDLGRIYAYPNANFGSSLSGTQWQTSFDLQMELFTSSNAPATTTTFNSSAYRFLIDTTTAGLQSGATADWDIAISLTYGYVSGAWYIRPSVVVGGISTAYTDIAFTPEQIGAEWFAPLAQFTLDINEINNTLSFTYGSTSIVSNLSIAGAFGTTDRYFGFASVKTATAPSTTVLQHRVDNLAITVIPEPSTYALIGLGLAGLVFFKKMRNRNC